MLSHFEQYHLVCFGRDETHISFTPRTSLSSENENVADRTSDSILEGLRYIPKNEERQETSLVKQSYRPIKQRLACTWPPLLLARNSWLCVNLWGSGSFHHPTKYFVPPVATSPQPGSTAIPHPQPPPPLKEPTNPVQVSSCGNPVDPAQVLSQGPPDRSRIPVSAAEAEKTSNGTSASTTAGTGTGTAAATINATPPPLPRV
ncbi:hypothetical protein MCOR02_004826 [Pyricularia oryzae]|nr:hypothetical protein MCOR02_004826 [Pyricularia oryzae]